MSAEKLLNSKKNHCIDYLDTTAAFIKIKIEEKTPITIIGVYDVDGVSGSTKLNKKAVRVDSFF